MTTRPFQTPNGDAVSLILDLENVRLAASVNQPATLTSDLRARFNQFDLKIQTEAKEGYTDGDGGHHDDARFFSLALSAVLDTTAASGISVPNFTLTAGQPVPPLQTHRPSGADPHPSGRRRASQFEHP